MLIFFFIFPTTILSKSRCFYDVPHSRVQRDALSKPTIEELLYELISSDSSQFLDAPQEELKNRVDWLIRVFEIGTDAKKRRLQRKSEMLRFFRETAHVFSPHTNYVEFANSIVPTLEEISARISHFGYEPLETLKMTYRKTFTRKYLKSSPEEQLTIIKESIIRRDDAPPEIRINHYIPRPNCQHLKFCSRRGKCSLIEDTSEEICKCERGFKGADCSRPDVQRAQITELRELMQPKAAPHLSTASSICHQISPIAALLVLLL